MIFAKGSLQRSPEHLLYLSFCILQRNTHSWTHFNILDIKVESCCTFITDWWKNTIPSSFYCFYNPLIHIHVAMKRGILYRKADINNLIPLLHSLFFFLSAPNHPTTAHLRTHTIQNFTALIKTSNFISSRSPFPLTPKTSPPPVYIAPSCTTSKERRTNRATN